MVVGVDTVAAVTGFKIKVFPPVDIGMNFHGRLVDGSHFAFCHSILVSLAIGEIDVVRGPAIVAPGTACIGHLIVDTEHSVEIGDGAVEPDYHPAGSMGTDAAGIGHALEFQRIVLHTAVGMCRTPSAFALADVETAEGNMFHTIGSLGDVDGGLCAGPHVGRTDKLRTFAGKVEISIADIDMVGPGIGT